MNHDLGKELVALPRLGVADLRQRYGEVFGEPTRTGNKAWLVKRIAWRLQMLAEGGIGDCRDVHSRDLDSLRGGETRDGAHHRQAVIAARVEHPAAQPSGARHDETVVGRLDLGAEAT